MFTDAILTLCNVQHREIMPGIIGTQGFRCPFLQKGKIMIKQRGLKHGPKSLLCPLKVAQWKQIQCAKHQDITVLSKLPLDNAGLDLSNVLPFQEPLQFNAKAWFYERKKLLMSERKQGRAERSSKYVFASAEFVT